MTLPRLMIALAMSLSPFAVLVAQDAPGDATDATRASNAAVLQQLDFTDRQDFEDAQRGFVATTPDLQLKNAQGRTVWTLQGFDFLKGDTAPATVNPSLWRQAQLNQFNGLFKVVDRVYQVRGFDLSNMTIVEGDKGLILIDPLLSSETAEAAMALYYQHRPRKPVLAVIYTHSHGDHFGGVKGVISEDDVRAGKVRVIAPDGFLAEAASENVYAGPAMARRGLYQFGVLLPRNERGLVDDGLGKAASFGSTTLIPPTDLIRKTVETRTVDGVQMEFHLAPGTEAPAEMLIYFPQFKLLDTAEDATHTQHNLYTLRGAQVRDARTWWKTLNLMLDRYGAKTDVIIAQHHWPMWGQQRINQFLADQRDMYKYIHDQTLNLANQGLTATEIAERIKLPPGLADKWYNRDYYGSVNHNAKAVYQRYLGWYDGNPAHLYALPPTESAKRYVEYMGGSAAVIAKARQSYAKGDYRWVAEVMNQVVFAEPDNRDARNLEADALEQLGYQSEDAIWRNNFLMGANELRHGKPKIHVPGVATPDVVQAMTPDMLLDYMGIRLDGTRANGKTMRINWVQPDTHQTIGITLHNSVLIYDEAKPVREPDATLTADKAQFARLAMGSGTLDELVQANQAKVTGDAGKLAELFGLLDRFDVMFNIIEP